MPETAAHDPPDDAVRTSGATDHPSIPRERLTALRGRGHEKYALMKTVLKSEPIDLIAAMKHGGWRFKARRGKPGVLVLDRDGNTVGDRMSFRQIAPVLAQLSGVEVTYETVRRWWEAVSDEPDEDDGADVSVATQAATARHTNPAVPPAAFLPPAG